MRGRYGFSSTTIRTRIYLIFVSLLFPASAGAGGFVVKDSLATRVVKDRGVERLGDLFVPGGMYRRGDGYVILDEGLGCLADFNYVEGLQLGPQLTVGHMTASGARWEVSPLVRYGLSSHAWSGALEVRRDAPVASELWWAVGGGEVTEDFNSEAYLRRGQRALAQSIFGWRHPKFYRRTYAQLRGGWAAGRDWLWTAGATWSRRRQLWNARHRSFLGSWVADNRPLVQGQALGDFASTEALELQLRAAYTPRRRVVVVNDRRALSLSDSPTLTAGVTVVSRVPEAHRSLSACRRHERWELGVEQVRRLASGYELSYRAEVGLHTGRRDSLLMDWKHFEASRFGWQAREEVTWFTLLDDYALSTDRAWALACGRLAGTHVLLPASWGLPPEVEERLGLRLLRVQGRPLHSEVEYAWAIRGVTQLGVSVGWSDGRYAGIGVRWVTRY